MNSILFLGLTLLFILIFYFANGRNKQVLLLNIAWALMIGSLAFLGVFISNPKLFIIGLIGTILLNALLLRKIKDTRLNIQLLLVIQSLRVIVELFLYALYLEKMIPKLMTFKGMNFDILIGFSSILFLFVYLFQYDVLKSWVFGLWNYLGILSLIIVVSIGVLSSPVPIQQFGFDQPNVAVLVYPYALLPTIIVPIAILAHVLLLIMWRGQRGGTISTSKARV
ncbi:hypothetical protein ACFX5U_04515 [Sphingobacterium sp. SG20118]|uniref:hypothetical protein n=1 Tax=Sphingobacterium sp. SG20118 TaxID=3367156 RepID=UPI0037DFC9A7